jgi:hypothetical protein
VRGVTGCSGSLREACICLGFEVPFSHERLLTSETQLWRVMSAAHTLPECGVECPEVCMERELTGDHVEACLGLGLPSVLCIS